MCNQIKGIFLNLGGYPPAGGYPGAAPAPGGYGKYSWFLSHITQYPPICQLLP